MIFVSTPAHRSGRRRYGAGVAALYHLALAADWEAARRSGRYTTSTRGRSLEEEGFIHCSFADQVESTAQAFYADAGDVVLLEIDPARLSSDVIVEGGFPHVYGALEVDAVVAATPWRGWLAESPTPAAG
jgi:glutathione S-transferase